MSPPGFFSSYSAYRSLSNGITSARASAAGPMSARAPASGAIQLADTLVADTSAWKNGAASAYR